MTRTTLRSSWLGTIGLALVAVIGVFLALEVAGVFWHVLVNPLVLITATVVAIELVLRYRAG